MVIKGRYGIFLKRVNPVPSSIQCASLTALRMDMRSNALAMKGGSFFVLSTSLVTTVLGCALTYTTIIVQFQVSGSTRVNQKVLSHINSIISLLYFDERP